MADWTYQLNCWYGIHVRCDSASVILELIENDREFSELAQIEGEVSISNATIVSTDTSDNDESPFSKVFFIDEMTIGGDEHDRAQACSLRLVPSEMEKLESRYARAVDAIDRLYVRLLKSSKVPAEDISVGWKTHLCEWDANSEESSEEAPAPSRGGAKRGGKSAASSRDAAQSRATAGSRKK